MSDLGVTPQDPVPPRLARAAASLTGRPVVVEFGRGEWGVMLPGARRVKHRGLSRDDAYRQAGAAQASLAVAAGSGGKPGDLRPGEKRTVAILVTVFSLLAILFVAVLPPLVVTGSSLPDGTPAAAKATAIAADRASFRTASLAALAGLGAALGLFYTHRTFRLQAESAAELEAERRRQSDREQRTFVAERFNDAVKQISEAEQTASRVAGVYSLGSVAEQDPKQHAPVVDVLTSLLTEFVAKHPERGALADDPNAEAAPLDRPVRAAAVALARLRAEMPVSLAGADLRGLQLQHARFAIADLRRATLSSADLTGASLRFARLEHAICARTNFSGADLQGAHLEGANLVFAKFEGADLRGARFEGAQLGRSALSDLQRRQIEGEPHYLPEVRPGDHR